MSNDTTFVAGTTISKGWLNDVNTCLWDVFGSGAGGDPPTTVTQALNNLGFSAFIQTLINDADQATAQTTLGVTSYVSVLTTIGDSIVATTAGAAARLAATATVAAHATTMNPWVAREIVASGGAVTLTDLADAPYVGATVSIYMNAAHIWTDGAIFSVQGNTTYTAAVGDWVDLVARSTVDAFDVFIRKADGTAVGATEFMLIAISDETTAITTGAAKVTFRMPYAFTLTSVRASLTTASSSGIPTVDIKESGTTILSTKLTIDATETTSATAATAAVLSDTSLVSDAEMTFNIDVAGTGATGLKVYLIGHKT